MPRLLPGTSPETDLYALTDDNLSLGRPVLEVAQALLDSGIKILQYREKDKKAGKMLEECLALRRMTRAAGACFIVNDHVDIAILCDADGVHVGQDDLPLPAVRRLVGPDMIVGLSTHTPEQAKEALAAGADYIGVGPHLPHPDQEGRLRSRDSRVSGLGRGQYRPAFRGHRRHQAT